MNEKHNWTDLFWLCSSGCSFFSAGFIKHLTINRRPDRIPTEAAYFFLLPRNPVGQVILNEPTNKILEVLIYRRYCGSSSTHRQMGLRVTPVAIRKVTNRIEGLVDHKTFLEAPHRGNPDRIG